jgi:hypothetical protein
MKTTPSQLKILSIDIGGSSIKATILDNKGNLKMDYKKVVTPKPANPENVIKSIKTLVKDYPPYDKVSVGFPGYVRNGVVKTAPNLGNDFWKDVNFRQKLEEALGKGCAGSERCRYAGPWRCKRQRAGDGNYPGHRFWYGIINGWAPAAAFRGGASPGIKGPRL